MYGCMGVCTWVYDMIECVCEGGGGDIYNPNQKSNTTKLWCVYVCMYVCEDMCMYVWLCYGYVYVCMYVCMYVSK